MAEGILREVADDLFVVFSAGSKPTGYVHPKGIQVMEEIGIDISGHVSKRLDEFLGAGIDTVITVCDHAAKDCPVFPGQVNRYHWAFEDPAKATGSEEEVLRQFRSIRDRMRLVFEAYVAGYRERRRGALRRAN